MAHSKPLTAGTYVVTGSDESKSDSSITWPRSYQFTLWEVENALTHVMANGTRAKYNLVVTDHTDNAIYPGKWIPKSRTIKFALQWDEEIYIYKGVCDTVNDEISGVWYPANPALNNHSGHCGTFCYQFEPTMNATVDAGCWHGDREGVSLRPQFKFGAKFTNWEAWGGLGDLTDGIEVGIAVDAFTIIRREGSTWAQVVGSLKLKSEQDMLHSPGFRQLFQILQEINKLTALIYEKTGINPSIDGVYFVIDAKIKSGASIMGKASLAWAEGDDGYRMLGVSGEIMAILAAKIDMFWGYNATENKYKIIVGAANVTLTIYIHVLEIEPEAGVNDLEVPLNQTVTSLVKTPYLYGQRVGQCLGRSGLSDEYMKVICDVRVMYWVPYWNIVVLLRCWYICRQQEYRHWRQQSEEFNRFILHQVISLVFHILFIVALACSSRSLGGPAWIVFLLLGCCCCFCDSRCDD
eukprot:792272_1